MAVKRRVLENIKATKKYLNDLTQLIEELESDVKSDINSLNFIQKELDLFDDREEEKDWYLLENDKELLEDNLYNNGWIISQINKKFYDIISDIEELREEHQKELVEHDLVNKF